MGTRAHLSLGFVALLWVGTNGCVRTPNDAVFRCEDDGGCPNPLSCQSGYCVNESCATLTCAQLGKNCGTLSDGCGHTLDCGQCESGSSCGTRVANECECAPESDQALCADAGYLCGTLSMLDHCLHDRSVQCGSCSGTNEVCSSGSCCQKKSDAQLCSENAVSCGEATLTDCGEQRTVNCGVCDGGSCDAGTAGCSGSCVPESDEQFCARTGIDCNLAPAALDNCGVMRSNVDCGLGACPNGRTCGADGGNHCP